VTRRGRALLDQIIEALRERGMVPIEADTDGVYFATPQEWTEAEERALVDEIGATRPSGIRLEYESRYAAMVSHAINNYALLSYSGELLVRGAAMRSSRSEPFGVRFYRAPQGVPVGLPDEADDASPISDEEDADEVEEREESLFSAASAPSLTDRRDYDIEYYLRILRDSYAERLRVVFEAEDFSQLFRLNAQQGMFDRHIEQMQLRWIRCLSPKAKQCRRVVACERWPRGSS
jgi:hypothetical protein